MTQYIPKAAITEKIRGLIKNAELYIEHHRNKNDKLRYSFENQRLVMYKLFSFLDTLEVKEFQEKNLYVVTRCKEHSDYVEKAFFSKKKAEEYCKQFESNEDAYGRDITEIKVDCPNSEIKEVDFEEEVDNILEEYNWDFYKIDFCKFAQHFFELGLKAKKG